MAAIGILAGIFAAACAVFYVAADASSRRQRRVYERLNQLQWQRRPGAETAPAEGAVAGQRADLLPFVNRALERHGWGERLKRLLTQAGVSLRPYEFIIGVALATALGFGAGAARGDRTLAGLLTVTGAVGPWVALHALRARRVAQFSSQLPDALVLIASSIRSGYSFLRAMQVAATELPHPIKQEFERSMREAEIGHPLPTALQNMLRRVPVYDLELAVTAVGIQMQVGGNLAEVLDTIAETIRERVRTRRQIAALTAEGKLSGIIAFVLPWIMFVAMDLLNPSYMKPFFTDPLGHLLLAGAFGLQLVGGFWMKRMLSMDL